LKKFFTEITKECPIIDALEKFKERLEGIRIDEGLKD